MLFKPFDELVTLILFILFAIGTLPLCSGQDKITKITEIEDVNHEVGICVTAMIKHVDRLLNLFEHWKTELCSGKRLILFLSTDSPAEYREILSGDLKDIELRHAPDLGDRINRLHRFHNLLDHEAAITSRGTRMLFSVNLAGDDVDPTTSNDHTQLPWFFTTTHRHTPLVAWHPPHTAACWNAAPAAAGEPQRPLCDSGLHGAIGGLASALLDMAAAIRAAVDTDHARHLIAPGLDSQHLSAYAARHRRRFRLLPAPPAPRPRPVPRPALPPAPGLITAVGYPGRLGNWLFRAAAALALGWDTGRRAVLPEALPCLADDGSGSPPPPCTFLGSYLSAVPRIPDLDGSPLPPPSHPPPRRPAPPTAARARPPHPLGPPAGGWRTAPVHVCNLPAGGGDGSGAMAAGNGRRVGRAAVNGSEGVGKGVRLCWHMLVGSAGIGVWGGRGRGIMAGHRREKVGGGLPWITLTCA
jgi:hypothetical protein